MTNRAMTVDGLERHYLLFTPRNYASIAHLPLLLFFHGATWTNEWAIEHGFNDIADREGFIVVYPDSYLRPSRGWDVSSSVSNDMKFANQLIDYPYRHIQGRFGACIRRGLLKRWHNDFLVCRVLWKSDKGDRSICAYTQQINNIR